MCARRDDRDDWRSAWAAWCGPGFRPGLERGGPGRGRGGGPRRGRVFGRGDLKYVVLRLIARKPMHGYEVMQALEERSGGWYSASAGSVYPVLQLLQDQGYLSSVEEDGKRVYSITDEGRAFLDRHTDRVDDVMDRVADFAGRFTGREMEELTGAFMRLARTTFAEAMKARGDRAASDRIREILERAMRDIEGARRREGGADA